MNASHSSASLYRPFFTPAECARLDATPRNDVSSEINLLRILLLRLLAAVHKARSLELATQARVLAAFSHAGIVLARLVRLQFRLHDPGDEIQKEIERGKEIARRRMGVHDYFKSPVPEPSS